LWADFSEASCEHEVLAAKRIKSKTWSAILKDERAMTANCTGYISGVWLPLELSHWYKEE